MISRRRSRVKRPQSLTKETSGKTETDRAISKFLEAFDEAVKDLVRDGHDQQAAEELARRELKSFPGSKLFKRYRGDDVKAALMELFEGKCAYCEKRFAATQPMDVEHFRPKGEIRKWPAPSGKRAELIASPGYYWLAADWRNLLPSCIDCNRGREQENARFGRVETLGKQNFFPVKSTRQLFHSESRGEETLLLDPCEDEPQRHLEYSDEGLVLGKTEKGDMSIEVYGLNRRSLVEERRERQLKLLMRIDQLKRLAQIVAELSRDLGDSENEDQKALLRRTCDLLRETMQEIRNELAESMQSDSEFALMARQRLAKFQAQLERRRT